ncbi:chromate transporter [Acinetobacter sp. WCHAc060025]|uniref:chromate transporter n=1 Tax=Acinetobacter sp. WCHAc060025 TaxID=2518625 RepID=UPI001022D96C|nr:chromate transporter [Acinetobacter sp. WCHAc060025]RZG74800.1 chromate transporter [Acinetobacter sp. WCHAc060025]
MNTDAISMQQNLVVPNCKTLFLGFMKLGLMGFGGVLPLARHMIVEEQKWLSSDKFTDLLGVCQILPGGNIVNMAVAIGYDFAGAKGAFSAVFGLMLAPTVIVISLYQIYVNFQEIQLVQHMIQGLAAAAAGLLFATGFKMLKPLMKKKLTYFTILLTIIFMLLIKLPLALTLLILVTINMSVLTFKRRSEQANNIQE